MHSTSDVVVCNNEKLASDSTEEYVLSATHFLRNNIFKEGEAWPDLIVTAANLVARLDSENLAIEASKRVLWLYSGSEFYGRNWVVRCGGQTYQEINL